MNTKIAWLAIAAVWGSTACLDVTPIQVTRTSEKKPREEQCLACLSGPSKPGPGCGDERRGCFAEPGCQAEWDCSMDIGHCYGGSRDDLAVCAQTCLKNGYFKSGDDPALVVSSVFYECIVNGACSEICFGSDNAGAADAGAPQPTVEAGSGACVNSADTVIVNAGLGEVPKNCAVQCLSSTDPGCNASCVEKGAGLSPACSHCFGDSITCNIKQCISVCVNSESQACKDCNAQKCDPAFKACSGS